MHKSDILFKNGAQRRYVSEVEAFGERARVKTIKKKGYFESADELQSLINNLSLILWGKTEGEIRIKKLSFLKSIGVSKELLEIKRYFGSPKEFFKSFSKLN